MRDVGGVAEDVMGVAGVVEVVRDVGGVAEDAMGVHSLASTLTRARAMRAIANY